MKIDSYQVGFDVTHQNLGVDYKKINVSQTKTALENGQAAKIESTQSRKDNTDYVDAKISRKMQAEMLQRLRQMDKSAEFESISAEYEELNFQTKAIIKADGKELSVDLSANLKRSFVEHQKIVLNQKVLTDPLVISLDGNMPQLGKTTFEFDIDSDGKRDQISNLRYGSGFLALDKNENGQIDDGSELFGTKSGDGFRDLQAYDDDGNGWIDENDEIFDKLRIWQKTDGGDKLVGIGEVGIGAIFLGNATTEFSYKSLEDNSLQGQMRNSGFFVFEDGKAGVMSQVDLAVQGVSQETNEKIQSIKEALEKLDGTGIYNAQGDTKSEKSSGESPIDKIKSKIQTLKAKLAKASPKEAAIINAQIMSLQAQVLTLMKMGL